MPVKRPARKKAEKAISAKNIRKAEEKAEPVKPVRKTEEKEAAVNLPEDIEIPDIPYDLMTVEQLQAVILSKMAKNGPVTERMRRDVTENVWHNSLVNWANSFH